MKRLLTLIGIAAILVGGSVAGSVAGVKTIKPDQLKPYRSTSDYYQSSDYVQAAGVEPVSFIAEVKLPVGKTINKLTYYHSAFSSASIAVFLYRTKMGEKHKSLTSSISFEDTTGMIVPVVETNIMNAKIKSGYTYWISAVSSNDQSLLHGIKITYN